MRVLLLNHEFVPVGGGAARATYEIARELAGQGHRVRVLTSNANGALPRAESVDGIAVRRVAGWRRSALENRIVPTFLAYQTLGAGSALTWLTQEPADVVHAFFTIPAGWVGCLLRRLKGVPLVISLRGSDVPGYNPREPWMPRMRPLIAALWRRADAVVALSEGLRRLALETWRAPERIRVIHNGVDTTRFRPAPSARDDGGARRLVSVGRLEAHKGQALLIQALHRLRDRDLPRWELRIVGEGSHRRDLESLTASLGLNEQVRFTGRLPQDEVAAELAAADLFVLPSLSEAFGQVVTEAMACGLPVVATRVGGVPEIVTEGVHGWLAHPDSESLATVLDLALRRPLAEWRGMGGRNGTYVSERFRWSAVARQYLEIYAAVVR